MFVVIWVTFEISKIMLHLRNKRKIQRWVCNKKVLNYSNLISGAKVVLIKLELSFFLTSGFEVLVPHKKLGRFFLLCFAKVKRSLITKKIFIIKQTFFWRIQLHSQRIKSNKVESIWGNIKNKIVKTKGKMLYNMV